MPGMAVSLFVLVSDQAVSRSERRIFLVVLDENAILFKQRLVTERWLACAAFRSSLPLTCEALCL